MPWLVTRLWLSASAAGADNRARTAARAGRKAGLRRNDGPGNDSGCRAGFQCGGSFGSRSGPVLSASMRGATFRGGFRASAEAPGAGGNAGGAARWPGVAGKPARTSAAGRDADARMEERLAPAGRSSRVWRDGEDVMGGGTISNMAREGTA